MNLTWDVYAAAFSQLLPVLAALRYVGRLPALRRWFALWCLLSFLADAAQYAAARLGGTNLLQFLLMPPLLAAVMFWVLAHLQTEPTPRKLMRLGVTVVVPLAIVVALVFERTGSYGDKSGPFVQLSLLAACVYTLVSRSLAASESLTRQDWFWMMLGASLYYAVAAALGAVATALRSADTQFLLQVFGFRARADILAFILMTIGMLWPLPRKLSLKPT